MRGLDRLHQFVGQREFLRAARLDLGEDADATQQMLVHRIVVIHVELHHRDDLAEGAHEAAEYARLVHAPQHHFGAVAREDLEKQRVRGLVVAQLLIDQPQRTGRRVHRSRVEREIVLLREAEDADEVDGIAPEDVRVRDVDAVVIGDEVLRVEHDTARPRLEARHQPVEHRRGLCLALLQRGREDRREVAHILRHQEVVLHEALDVAHAGMRRVAEPHRNLALDVEGQPLLRASHDEMHVAAHRPEEILSVAEHLVFRLIEDAALDQLFGAVHAIDVLRDPEQRVQIAQARPCRP